MAAGGTLAAVVKSGTQLEVRMVVVLGSKLHTIPSTLVV